MGLGRTAAGGVAGLTGPSAKAISLAFGPQLLLYLTVQVAVIERQFVCKTVVAEWTIAFALGASVLLVSWRSGGLVMVSSIGVTV